MAKAKRVKGTRDIPNLPKLKSEDYIPFLWIGVNKGSWSIEEAAYYLNEKEPAGPIDPRAISKVSQIYMWLLKEHDNGRLKNITGHDDPPLFSPGTFIRYMWENERYFSLKVWALYDAADRGEVEPAQYTGIAKKNYQIAAKIIKDKYPNATKVELIEALLSLPASLTKKDGLPLFFPMSRSYLEKVLKDFGKGKGRPKKGVRTQIDMKDDQLLDLILKEIGH